MNLNPFDLRGPDFLVFYIGLSAVVLVAAWLILRAREAGQPGDEAAWGAGVAKDPYQMAYLRGGRVEAIQVAVVSLIERQLLTVDGDKLHATSADAADLARRPLDKAILTKFADPAAAQSLYTDEIVTGEADAIGETLKDKGLVPDDATRRMRVLTALSVVGLLWLVAGVKIAVALSRGRHNIVFLVVLAVVVAVVGIMLAQRPRTVLGSRTLAFLRQHFAGLNGRRETLRLDGKTGEVAFLAAVFGMAALPSELATFFQRLDLRPPRPQHGGWGSCGSSSCGGGGGGGCGGGGCGGGCGGCG